MASSIHKSDCGREYPTLEQAEQRDALVAAYKDHFKVARDFQTDKRRDIAAIRAADDHEAIVAIQEAMATDGFAEAKGESHEV